MPRVLVQALQLALKMEKDVTARMKAMVDICSVAGEEDHQVTNQSTPSVTWPPSSPLIGWAGRGLDHGDLDGGAVRRPEEARRHDQHLQQLQVSIVYCQNYCLVLVLSHSHFDVGCPAPTIFYILSGSAQNTITPVEVWRFWPGTIQTLQIFPETHNIPHKDIYLKYFSLRFYTTHIQFNKNTILQSNRDLL